MQPAPKARVFSCAKPTECISLLEAVNSILIKYYIRKVFIYRFTT